MGGGRNGQGESYLPGYRMLLQKVALESPCHPLISSLVWDTAVSLTLLQLLPNCMWNDTVKASAGRGLTQELSAAQQAE